MSIRRILPPLLLAGAAALPAQTALLLPAAANNADLASSVSWPFDSAAARTLYVLSAQHFRGQGVTGPIVLQRLRARADAGIARTWSGSSIAALRIDLSTSPLGWQNTSATFDQNHGNNRVTVFQGAVTIAGGTVVAPGSRGPVHVDITFATPFLYDPVRGGDLTLDLVSSGVLNAANTPPQDASATTGEALARRVHSLTPTATTGTLAAGEACGVFGLAHVVDSFAADFAASPTAGSSPLTVRFTDLSSSTAPGGVVGWEWDFDNDGTWDSTVQNPTHAYTATCAAFSPTLRVRDGWNRTRTLNRPDLIRVGAPAVNFAWQPMDPPDRIQFTNLSPNVPGTWAWDFDGDGVTDSTARDPGMWTYPTRGVLYQVRLTGNLPCGSQTFVGLVATDRQVGEPSAGPLFLAWFGDTVFADLEVAAPGGIFLQHVSTIWNNAVGSPGLGCQLYLTDAGWVGRQGNPSAWWQLPGFSLAVPLLVPDQPPRPLYTTFSGSPSGAAETYLPQGRYGLAVRYSLPPPPTAYLPNRVFGWHWDQAGPVRITNTRRGTLGTAATDQDDWAGRLHYLLATERTLAGYATIGPGCPGPLDQPRLLPSNLPRIGTVFQVSVDRLPMDAAFFATGFSATGSALGPLPLELGLYGMSGCWLRMSPDSLAYRAGPAGSRIATWLLTLPADPNLLGVAFYNQALVPAPGWNLFGAVLSSAFGGVIGS